MRSTPQTPGHGWTPLALAVVSGLILSLGVPVGAADFDVQGHRGCRGLVAENTLAAFIEAVELGVTTLELDLQVTRDGALVVHHDHRLNGKLCVHDDGSAVARTPFDELDLADLADVDCGSRTNGKFPRQVAAPGARIPRLTEVLAIARDAAEPVRVSIEIKQKGSDLPLSVEALIDRLATLATDYGLAGRIAIQSYSPEVLAVVRDRAPGFERALLVRFGSFRGSLEDGVADVVSMKDLRLRRKHVRRIQASGARVVPWTVNRPKRLRTLIEWGVDGVITDYPDRALAAEVEVRAH